MRYVYDFYTGKRNRLDGLYMPRGVAPASPDEWELRATAYHPNALVIRAVERDGFCARPYPNGIDAQYACR
jgi:hypothetical protein